MKRPLTDITIKADARAKQHTLFSGERRHIFSFYYSFAEQRTPPKQRTTFRPPRLSGMWSRSTVFMGSRSNIHRSASSLSHPVYYVGRLHEPLNDLHIYALAGRFSYRECVFLQPTVCTYTMCIIILETRSFPLFLIFSITNAHSKGAPPG